MLPYASSCQKYFGRVSNNTATIDSSDIIIVFFGESNSGGIAANSYATSSELAKRKLQILNNTSLTSFDSLDIGSNNLTGHCGLQYAASTGHGIELQLANRYDSGAFGSRNVYLVKAGQGGTTIAQWDTGGTYTVEWTATPRVTFFQRVDSALSIIPGTPRLFFIWSQGINDGGSNPSAWKAKVSSLFNEVVARYGSTFFYITRFDSMGDYYYTQMSELASERADTRMVSSLGCETTKVVAGAGFHWGYDGMKILSNRIIDSILTDL